MKRLLALLTVLLFSLSAQAQAPPRFNFQAVIRTPGGSLVVNRGVGVRISLLQSTATGTAVYVETHAPTTNANGQVTLDIGGGTPVSGAIANIVWYQGPYFIKIDIDPITSGGSNYTITGTSQLLSVPYASFSSLAGYAITAGHAVGELYGGGIVFSVWRDALGVEHGLIASLDNIGAQIPWSPTYIQTAAVGQSFINGATNTAAIVAHLGNANAAGSAAGLCDNYSADGFSDWYLPSAAELQLLASQMVPISAILDGDNLSTTNGLFSTNGGRYWSSTIADTQQDASRDPAAYCLSLRTTINSQTSAKNSTLLSKDFFSLLTERDQTFGQNVRAIRKF